MILSKKSIKALIASSVISLGLFAAGCGVEEEESDKDATDSLAGGTYGTGTRTEGITLSGTLSGLSLNLAVTDYKMYCVTFESTPEAALGPLDSSGAFSVDVWTGVNFGCFLNNANNIPVATMVFEDDGEGFGSESSSGVALGQSVDLGAISVANGTISVPKERIESAQAAASSQIDVDDLHEQGYTMSCTTSGIDEVDSNCDQFVADSPSVYFRVLKATENGEAVQGVGVWADEASFTACGSIDFEASEVPGVDFSQGTAGTFPTGDTGCELRDESDSSKGPRNRYALAKLTPTGLGYSMQGYDEWTDGDCTRSEHFSVDFTGTATNMSGLFSFTSASSGTCSEEQSSEDGTRLFTVNFTAD